MKTYVKSLDLGIIPEEKNRFDFRRAMMSLPLDDRRKSKRKFRKLWRKLRDLLKETRPRRAEKLFPEEEQIAGRPSRQTMHKRKQEVYNWIKSTSQDVK